MRTTRSPLAAVGATMLATGLTLVAAPYAAAEQPPSYTVGDCPAPAEVPAFEQGYIDESRAGGEPIVETHPDGTLLWGSHAGTTHFYAAMDTATNPESAVFLENYEGQSYYYFSEDNGDTWTFVPRTPAGTGNGTAGVPNSGFSDPEFAIDLAGNVYISEINLANIAVSKSTDSGRSYTLQSLVEITASDRQWMEADEEDVLYFVANTFGGGSTSSGNAVTGSLGNAFYKSVDGGQTFSEPQEFVGGQASSDIKVDKNDGTVYQLDTRSADLGLFRLPNARDEMPPNMTVERFTIAASYESASSIDPTIELDAEGNLYVTWAGKFEGDHGVWFTYSTDRGETWSFPLQLTEGDETAIWSWIKVGDVGGVSVSWLEADSELPANDQEATDGPWHVYVAISQNGLGCGQGEDVQPGFVVTQASIEPPHTGQICGSGTVCQAPGPTRADRRLGDYFAHTIDENGNTLVSVSDTRRGAAIALPLQIRQTSGPTIGSASMMQLMAPENAKPMQPTTAPAPAPAPAAPPVAPIAEALPTTGGGAALAALGLVTLGFGLRRRS